MTIPHCFKTLLSKRFDGLLVCWVCVVWFSFYQIPLLKRLLASGCWILGTFAIRSETSGIRTCHLPCLLPPLRLPGGPWDDPASLGSRKEGNFEVQASFFVDFVWIEGPRFESFLGTFGTKNVYLFMLVSKLLFLVTFGF